MSKKTCGIYKITSPSGRVYIGQSRNIEVRFRRYKRLHAANKTQIRLDRSFIKYGVDNHIFEIIEECEFEKMNIRERYWQDFYDVLNGGLNCVLTETDVLPRVITDEHREKISGKNHWLYGKKHSKESKIRMSKSATGRKVSKETKKKLSKIREGEGNNFYGKKHSKLSRKKQSEAAKKRKTQNAVKKVYQYDLNSIFVKEWNSAFEASNEIGISSSGISACAHGRQKTAGGYKWSFNKLT